MYLLLLKSPTAIRDKERAKARLRAAFNGLREQILRASDAMNSPQSRRAMHRALESLRKEVEADRRWLDDLLREFGLAPKPPVETSS
jgi:hypothetical protein